MSHISVLEKQVSELIAAGEVVERPASAVKELLENSIDAGAAAITLEIKNGGVSFIRVTDDGCGILPAEMPTAFLRHATSKIHTARDLDGISTLGFRGEALASIAAVARVEMLSKTAGAVAGSHIRLEGGQVMAQDDAGCPEGTTILIRDLFYNTPARMKFLKKDVTESNAVYAVAQRIALSHPEVSLRFIKDGREELHTPGDGKLESAVYSLFGREFAHGLMPLTYELNGVGVSGFTGKPVASRANRGMQFFFLNGRLVKSKTVMAALEQAYRSSLMTGRYPCCVLLLTMPPHLVDVNVHPAKTEVRFANEKQVFDAVYYAVKSSLAEYDTRPEMDMQPASASQSGASVRLKPAVFEHPAAAGGAPAEQFTFGLTERAVKAQREESTEAVNDTSQPSYTPVQPAAFSKAPVDGVEAAALESDGETEQPGPAAEREAPLPETAEPLRVIGECFGTYIIAQAGDSLYFVDKHAAHERILYNELKARGRESAQMLLEPTALTLPAEEYSALIGSKELLLSTGFEIDDFGGSTVLIRSAPMSLPPGEVAAAVEEIAGGLCLNKSVELPEKMESICHSVACRAAVKAGDKTSFRELEALCRRVLGSKDIMFCPHGRPVAFSIPRRDFEKRFGRV